MEDIPRNTWMYVFPCAKCQHPIPAKGRSVAKADIERTNIRERAICTKCGGTLFISSPVYTGRLRSNTIWWKPWTWFRKSTWEIQEENAASPAPQPKKSWEPRLIVNPDKSP